MANNFEKISTLRTLMDQSYQNVFAAALTNAEQVVSVTVADYRTQKFPGGRDIDIAF
jgi:hypothetical protein